MNTFFFEETCASKATLSYASGRAFMYAKSQDQQAATIAILQAALINALAEAGLRRHADIVENIFTTGENG